MVQGAGAAGKGLEVQSSALANDKKGDASTEPKFGEIWKKIQSEYGAKAEKPREIKKTLGKDDFLRIMITQMKNQDPTKPFGAEEMAAQMAQMTSVEQLKNLNESVAKLASNDRPMERLAMTSLIGKQVMVDRDRFLHKEGSNEYLGFALPTDAGEAKISIISETGETVLEKDLGPLKAGDNGFSWNGLKSNDVPAKAGTYYYRLSAQTPQGQSISVSSRAEARVVGVSFDGAEPVFLVGNPTQPTRIAMSSIVQIQEGSGGAPPAPAQAPIPGAQSLGQAVQNHQAPTGGSGLKPVMPQQGANAPNFFTFEKGVGSKPVDPSRLPPEAAAALAKYTAQKAEYERAQAAQNAAANENPSAAEAEGETQAIPSEGKGFPNGLSSHQGASE